jgi:hypothetical protein
MLLTESERARQDIAAVNLACAAHLPGGPTATETEECLKRLDEYAAVAREYTLCCFPQFTRKPGDYRHSLPYFRTLCLVTAVWQKCGIRYNMAKVPEEVPLDAADVFIHGPLLGKGGTCASLPVVYSAVGRRLGYPINLVAARSSSGHLFARWEGPDGERFNIDVSPTGLCSHPDDFYRTGDFALSPQEERDGGYLKSMTPRQEMAGFLVNRGKQWARHGQHRLAVEALAQAAVLVPDLPIYLNTVLQAMHVWKDNLDRTRPPVGFPQLWLRADRRRYPALPVDVEEGILALEATETLLKRPELEARWWGPMRKGRLVPDPPKLARAEFRPTQECQVFFQF